MILMIVALILIGLVASTFGSIVGLGGGIIIVPALIMLGPLFLENGISSTEAVGTSLTVLIFTALSSLIVFMKKKRVDFRSGWLFFITSGPASLLGASLTDKLNGDLFELVFGLFMFGMAILMLFQSRMKPRQINWPIQRTFTDGTGTTVTFGYSVLPALAIGFCVGMISGLFGIGGGSLFVPLMVLLFRFPPHIASATSMFVIFLSSILGSSVHAFNGDVHWMLVLILAPSAYIGGKIGAHIAGRLSGGGLLWVLRITLLILAVRMIISGLS